MSTIGSPDGELVNAETPSDESTHDSNDGWVDVPGHHPWQEVHEWKGDCYTHLIPSITAEVKFRDMTQPHPDSYHVQESSLSLCDSIDLSAIAAGKSTLRDRGLPPYLVCLTTLTITDARHHQGQRSRRFINREPHRIPWQFESTYHSIHNEMKAFAYQRVPKAKCLYPTTSHVRILHWTDHGFEEANSCVIVSEQDWIRRVPDLVATYCSCRKQLYLPFYLEINSSFGYFKFTAPKSNHKFSYAESIRSILEETELKNFEESPYWSKIFLKLLFDVKMVQEIVQAHIVSCKGQSKKSKKKKPLGCSIREQCDQFVEWLVDDRIRLLATTIRCRISIHCLHELMKNDHDNIRDNFIPIEKTTLLKFLDSGDAETFMTCQKGFQAYNFPDPESESENLKDDVVKPEPLIPIHFDRNDPFRSGGFGKVYKANIHPEFHGFTADRNETYALKVISVSHITNDEMKVWKLVAGTPHPHITPLHASWFQNNQCFMVSPLADKSLDEFLASSHRFVADQEIIWLLGQLEGLCDGIHHIHHIGRVSLKGSELHGKREWIISGYHHDLKPANILVFGQKTWKIGDFGTAGIRQLVSGKTLPFHSNTTGLGGGDSEYGGPDRWEPNRHVGRSYDIWSFGCIILEVLLWALGQGGEYLTKFQTDRAADPCDICSCPEQSPEKEEPRPKLPADPNDNKSKGRGQTRFWYKCKHGQFYLKKSVKQRIEWVKKQAGKTEHCQLLADLGDFVEKMLNVEPQHRPTVSDVKDRIGELHFRANFHFRHRNAISGAEIRTQPDTFRGPPSLESSHGPSSRQARRGGDNGESSTPPSRKRKARYVDKQASEYPVTKQGDFQYTGAHLPNLSMPGTSTLGTDSPHYDSGPQVKKPRASSRLRRDRRDTTPDELVKNSSDPPVLDRMTEGVPSETVSNNT